jgi:predicted Zn-dependent protease
MIVVVVVACYTVPETGRSSFNLIDQNTEMKLGFDAFQDLKRKEKISTDPKYNAQLQRVGKRISAVANLPNAQWEFVVFDSNVPNAFCLPGGKVGFYTAIMPICGDDDGVAAVMGHEVAHAVARHGGERMTDQLLVAAGGVALSEFMKSKPQQTASLAMMAYGAGATLGAVLPHSRMQESEADHIGIIYMAKAGYDPNAAVGFWQRFAATKQGGRTPEFLSTHPVDETRIANLKKWLPEAMPYYEAAKASGVR